MNATIAALVVWRCMHSDAGEGWEIFESSGVPDKANVAQNETYFRWVIALGREDLAC